MKLLPFLFGYIFKENAGHSIVKRAGPISQTNICINECTGVADDWTDVQNIGITVDGNVPTCGLTSNIFEIKWIYLIVD